ncbi:MAG: potassium channel family protein [Candidatus Heimdallarchaeota archaeon]|nr:MAG: hypothetical protein DRO63_07865 [Candidatus Gerdarchaeota archaeon]RLI68322.1 MAG: hypothetical protein DRP02_12785 [Candidatus Gerdarchaeota archaeon]RLI72293.1 MAG: hypothetical protein DRO91_04680 [Candidatus Heimdallarchaeota archaeon]
MPYQKKLLTLKNQLRRFLLPFSLFILFWIFGIVIFSIIEPNKTFKEILLISICLKTSDHLFYNFYQFLWPLLFELLVLTFILTTLQEFYGYNPMMAARRLASRKTNHTVILGYNHLGERIVDYLRQYKHPYTLVEIKKEKVEELINFNQPVIVGDYTDIEVMQLANVHKCKEVFCVTNDLRRALIAAEHVRRLNKDCALYMRVFNEHFRDFLTKEPWNAFTFSTSKWALESVKKWSQDYKPGDEVIVLGNDSIVNRIVDYYARELKAEIYLLDPEANKARYRRRKKVHVFNEEVLFLSSLENYCNLMKTSQIYICWNSEETFSDAILLTNAIGDKYPHIQVFVRIFDEELATIAKSLKATTFSTSAYAFKMLQQEVTEDSGIFPGE